MKKKGWDNVEQINWIGKIIEQKMPIWTQDKGVSTQERFFITIKSVWCPNLCIIIDIGK